MGDANTGSPNYRREEGWKDGWMVVADRVVLDVAVPTDALMSLTLV